MNLRLGVGCAWVALRHAIRVFWVEDSPRLRDVVVIPTVVVLAFWIGFWETLDLAPEVRY